MHAQMTGSASQNCFCDSSPFQEDSAVTKCDNEEEKQLSYASNVKAMLLAAHIKPDPVLYDPDLGEECGVEMLL